MEASELKPPSSPLTSPLRRLFFLLLILQSAVLPFPAPLPVST